MECFHSNSKACLPGSILAMMAILTLPGFEKTKDGGMRAESLLWLKRLQQPLGP